jgi:hypothetical protein
MMTDRLALLREEIQAEISMRCAVIQGEQAKVEVLRAVLARMDRIEREHPAEAAPVAEAETGRAARRDLRAEITTMLLNESPLSLASIASRLSITESAATRALDPMVSKRTVIRLEDGFYYRPASIEVAEAAQ